MNGLSTDKPEMYNSWKHWINNDYILHVPNEYGSIQDACEFLADKNWHNLHPPTIKIAEGTRESTTSIENLDNVIIEGANLLETTITSLSGISGSQGDWDVVINISDTANIIVGQFAIIRNVTGTGDHLYHSGCWEITAINAGVSITVKNTKRDDATFVSTLTGGDIIIPPTIIKENTNNDIPFTLIDCNNITFKNIVIEGVGGINYGIHAIKSKITVDTVGVNGFSESGIFISFNSAIHSEGNHLNISDSVSGLGVSILCTADINHCIFTGNSNQGLWVFRMSQVAFGVAGSIALGNTTDIHGQDDASIYNNDSTYDTSNLTPNVLANDRSYLSD